MKKKRLFAICLAFYCCFLAPLRSIAWGADGHRLIVQMALSLLTPQARQHVLAALGPDFTPEKAAVWMDVVRAGGAPKYKFMKNWHFVNMEANQTYPQVANKNDVVFNLQRMIVFFNHVPPGVSKDSVQTNLRILFHLMGDITQPLHVGYGHDTGGNGDPVITPVFNQKDNNLHHVWDDVILWEGKINLQTSQAYFHTLNPAQLAAIKQGQPQSWLTQARSFLPAAYAPHPTKTQTTTLTKAYLDTNVPVVQQQLVYAAVRLAAVLQQAYGN